jgi:hypothetical protein
MSPYYLSQPNDLQLLSDAPAHKLYVLLGPGDQGSDKIPDVLCVIQVWAHHITLPSYRPLHVTSASTDACLLGRG